MKKKEQEALKQHIIQTINLLEAGATENAEFIGYVGTAPFIWTVLGDETAQYLFRIRTKEKISQEDDWVLSVKEEFPELDMHCKVDEGYIHLTIFNVMQLTPEQVAAAVKRCAADHSDLLPTDKGFCHHCQAETGGELLVLGGNVASICPACQERLRTDVEARFKEANPFAPKKLLYLPAALTVSGLGWFLCWWGFDSALGAAGEISLPVKITAAVMLLIGLAVGWPIGKMVQTSGIAQKLPVWLIASVLCVLTVLVGEAAYALMLMGQSEEKIPLSAVPMIILFMNSGANGFYLLLKGAFAFGIGISVYQLIKPKPVEVQL